MGVEQVLTNWARSHRFAGSGDRSAIRDLVFDVVRRRRSCALAGGGEDGRALVLGHLRQNGADPALTFTGEGYAPPPLSAVELGYASPLQHMGAENIGGRLDWPDWLLEETRRSLGADTEAVLEVSRERAPIFLRVNIGKVSREAAQHALSDAGIDSVPHPDVKTALMVQGTPRGLKACAPWRDGWVELQDAASQAVVVDLPLLDGMRVLDFCAGGGGKTLAMAGCARLKLFAHDAAPERMRDLPARAARAGVRVETVQTPEDLAPFDLVLADVPCSGSGSWRRAPEGKWRLTPEMLSELVTTQDGILDRAASLAEGFLAYSTCSVFHIENRGRIDDFLRRNPAWSLVRDRKFLPGPLGDGFYFALMKNYG